MERVVQLENPLNNSLLARIRVDGVSMDEARRITVRLYGTILRHVLHDRAPTRHTEVVTSMAKSNPEAAIWKGAVIDTSIPIVVSAIARGGLLPSNVVMDELALYGYAQTRMDCLMMNRTTAPDGHVNGVGVQGLKMGNSVEGAIVLYPDCMVATGRSLVKARTIYEQHHGKARWHIVCALICTWDGIRTVMDTFPDTIIYTLAVDDKLDPHDYILPGAGDMGNKLNGPSDFHVLTGG